MADINDLIAHGITPPNVETLGDAFARMHATQQSQAEGRQRLTLGDLQTQEGRIRLAQLKRDAQDDQAYRDTVIRNAGGGAPQQPQDDPGPAQAPQATQPQAGPVPQQAPPQQAPPQQAAPQAIPQQAPQPPTAQGLPANQGDITDRTIADLRRQGLAKQADAMAAAALEQKLKRATADKDAAQMNEFQQNANTKKEQGDNLARFNASGFLLGLPDDAARAAAFPQVMQQLAAAGHIDKAHAALDFAQYGGTAALQRDHQVAGTQADVVRILVHK